MWTTMLPPTTDDDHPLAGHFRDFVRSTSFPCVGAKSALAKGQMRIVVARDIRSGWDDLRIYPGLLDLAKSYADDPVLFQTFIVIFEQDRALSEASFESHMWNRIQSLSDKDEMFAQTADQRVSGDPGDPHFSLSFGGQAFFVVGLHPGASRPARRFERPAMVFNLHDQFVRLREEGRYEKLRASILDRDEALAGTMNPMLARHGELSEARQYSGREVGNDWECPFNSRDAA
jgi:FPC/CPF motif-containing protein YcgG